MSLVDHPICQPSLDISPIWTPIIAVQKGKDISATGRGGP
jgi:hypothetical protein